MPAKNVPAVIDPTETALTLESLLDDFASDGAEDLAVTFPDIKLIQGTTRGIANSERHIGDFYHSDTQQFDEKLEVIPLYMQTQRAIFEDGVEAPGCMSVDGISPLPNQPLWTKEKILIKQKLLDQNGMWQPEYCADCPYSRFKEDGTPPPCGETILMMVRRDDDSFARLRIGRTGLKPVRDAAKKLQFKGRRLPIFTSLWSFSSVSKETPGRKWSQLQVSTTPLPPAEVVAINAIAKAIRSQIQEVAADTNFAAEAEAAGPVIDQDEVPF